jgi:hypothetical protein
MFPFRKFREMFSEDFFKTKKFLTCQKKRKIWGGGELHEKKLREIFPEVFLHRKRNLRGGKRNHPHLIYVTPKKNLFLLKIKLLIKDTSWVLRLVLVD